MGISMAKYSSISVEQAEALKEKIRKQIFFLLIIVDPKTKDNYKHVNVEAAFENMLLELNGANEIFMKPLEVIMAMTLLESALNEYKKEPFDFTTYRKLILDAGSKIKEVVVDANT
jgi:hypothetical protein